MQINETLYKGRPDNMRIEKEERCYALLDRLGIEYWRVDHEHADGHSRLCDRRHALAEHEDRPVGEADQVL